MSTEIFDVEVYADYFLVGFLNTETGATTAYEMYPGKPLNIPRLRSHMATRRLVSFNGKRFDAPLVAYALAGASCEQLKAAANDIITNNLQPWQFTDRHPCSIPEDWDHIDLFDVAPGMASLKLYAGRMHSRKLQDLPIEHDASITPEQRPIIRAYNLEGDLPATLDLWRTLQPQIALRERMTAEYGIDLRSKSDAQIAEAVIKSRAGRLVGREIKRPIIEPGTEFYCQAPDFIAFHRPELRHALEVVTTTPFVVPRGGSIQLPKAISDLQITIGQSTYQMGIGGLHSTESCVAHIADEQTLLIDRDVTSYYPSIILNCELYPAHIGRAFLTVYRDIVERRIAAKRAGDKVTADALKITINGTFGKLGSMWSAIYSPGLLIQTTIPGQLSLLMLIEMVEDAGARVVSANTDGVVIKCPVARHDDLGRAIDLWECITGFETEETRYSAVYSRDVNNYIAIKPDGSGKAKGAYAPAGLMKNPTAEICAAAVREYLARGTPVEQTIIACDDVRQFLVVRNVKGGAIWRDQYLGRVARWYYSANGDTIKYRVNGYKVARSDRARPLMDLPEGNTLPSDLDRDWYVAEAYNMLAEIGALPI